MKPTHNLKILDKENDYKTNVGVGWQNKDGSISISLNPAINLTYENCKNKVLTLFPKKD